MSHEPAPYTTPPPVPSPVVGEAGAALSAQWRTPPALETVVLHHAADGWRAALLDAAGNLLDATTDVYPTPAVLLSRIEELKTWFDVPAHE